MTVRNDAGIEGLVAWRKIQARQGAPVRLTYGYAMTVDTAQGSTATEHIHALPSGPHVIHGFKAYTATSRHERTTWIVVDEASERRQLASRSMIGQRAEIHEPDVWRQIGEIRALTDEGIIRVNYSGICNLMVKKADSIGGNGTTLRL